MRLRRSSAVFTRFPSHWRRILRVSVQFHFDKLRSISEESPQTTSLIDPSLSCLNWPRRLRFRRHFKDDFAKICRDLAYFGHFSAHFWNAQQPLAFAVDSLAQKDPWGILEGSVGLENGGHFHWASFEFEWFWRQTLSTANDRWFFFFISSERDKSSLFIRPLTKNRWILGDFLGFFGGGDLLGFFGRSSGDRRLKNLSHHLERVPITFDKRNKSIDWSSWKLCTMFRLIDSLMAICKSNWRPINCWLI